jgi:ribosomal protein S15P/S13E
MPLRAILTLLGLLALSLPGLAAETPGGAQAAQPGPVQAFPAPAPSVGERLLGILASIETAEAERAAVRASLPADASESEVTEVQGDLKRIERRLGELRASFADLATGGATVEQLEQLQQAKPFNWQAELEEILMPLLEGVKRMTERPRTIERLRSERAAYQARLAMADRAIARIRQTQAQTDAEAVQEVIRSLEQDWQSHRADIASRLQLIETQLGRLLAPEDEGAGVTETVRKFLAGRGLNIVLAAGTFVLTYALLAGIGGVVGQRLQRREAARVRRLAKAGGIVFRAVSVLLALFGAMVVLSVRGDWLILGLLILFLLGAALTLRSSLPRFVGEIRILLNMGGVREGERVVYNGIPWQIKSLNFFSTLHNPLLQGGTIRVPIEDMARLQSRQYVKEEPWFPSRGGDFVMLEGDVFGKVLLQTPEVVALQVAGATKTYPIADYLAQRPRNLSLEGFAVPVTVGLDYRHQPEILSAIVNRLRAHLEERLEDQVFRRHLKDLVVEFNEAASSSLNIIVVAIFQGAAAEYYWPIRRFLQRAAVEACNRYGWDIPFDQLTVHLQPASASQVEAPG